MDKTSFRARDEGVFGSLSPLLSSSSCSSSIDVPRWFLPDNGVKKRLVRSPSKDKVEDRDEVMFSLSLADYLDKNWKIQESNFKKLQDVWKEVEKFIGLGSILDNEEEKDGYDIIAEGRGLSSSCSALPISFKDQVDAQIRLKEDTGETYEDDDFSFNGIVGAFEGNFQSKSILEGKKDTETVAVMSTKSVAFNLPRGLECKPASNKDQGLKSILKRKANGDNHFGGTKSVKQVSFHDLDSIKAFHGAKDIGNSASEYRKHGTFDLACKDDGKWAPKKHQGRKSITERKIIAKKMPRFPRLNPQSLSALAQLARLILEVQQRKEGSSST